MRVPTRRLPRKPTQLLKALAEPVGRTLGLVTLAGGCGGARGALAFLLGTLLGELATGYDPPRDSLRSDTNAVITGKGEEGHVDSEEELVHVGDENTILVDKEERQSVMSGGGVGDG